MARQNSTHLPDRPGVISPYVLLPGDPGRVDVISRQLDDVQEISSHREFRTITGTYQGMRITCTSTGIGCPSTAIALEELARSGAHTFFRIGTCGAIRDDISVGDIVIFDSAARYDGTTARYAPIEIPAVAHHDVVAAAQDSARELKLTAHTGTTRTSDTFYAGHPNPGSSFNGYWRSQWRDWLPDMRRCQVAGAEMEASAVLLLPRLWGLRGGGAAVVLDKMIIEGDTVFDANTHLDRSPSHIERIVTLGCETLARLAQRDHEKSLSSSVFHAVQS